MACRYFCVVLTPRVSGPVSRNSWRKNKPAAVGEGTCGLCGRATGPIRRRMAIFIFGQFVIQIMDEPDAGFRGSRCSTVAWRLRDAIPRTGGTACFSFDRKMIVFYTGDNDLAAGKSAKQVAADYRRSWTRVHAKLPKTVDAYLSSSPALCAGTAR